MYNEEEEDNQRIFRIAREESTRENCYFYHVEDGFYYHKSHASGNNLYFKCKQYGGKCGGRAIFHSEKGFMHTKDHDHPPDPMLPQVVELKRRIIARCKTLDYVSLAQIIDTEAREFPLEVSTQVTLQRMRPAMRNARTKNYPARPTTLLELTELLQNDNYRVITMTEDGADSVYGGSVTALDGSHHVMFTSDRLLYALGTEFSTLHSDGTFKVVPAGLNLNRRRAQILTIVGLWDSHVIPLSWIIMEKKSLHAYHAVLQLLQQRLIDVLDGQPMQFNKVVTDFESALQNAWEDVFEVPVRGCLFHYAQAIVHGAMRYHLAWHLRHDESVLRMVRLVCVIPLLPRRYMQRGLMLIMREARRDGHYRLMRPFFQYVFEQWYGTKRKRRRLCMFMSKTRTNNASESHHRVMKDRIGIHPNIYTFIRSVVQIEFRSYRDISGLEEGRRVGRRRTARAVANDENLLTLSRQIINPPGNLHRALWRFLRRASYTLQNVVDNILDL